MFFHRSTIQNKEDYHSFRTDAEAQNWGIINFGKWHPNKNLEELIYAYCGSLNVPINRLLRNGPQSFDDDQQCDLPELYNKANILNSEILKFKIENDIIVYRSVPDFALKRLCNAQHFSNDRLLNDKGFMSTSLIFSVAKEHAQRQQIDFHKVKRTHVLKIYLPKDTRCAYLGLVGGMEQEQEILLPPNCTLKYYKKHHLVDYVIEYECLLISQ